MTETDFDYLMRAVVFLATEIIVVCALHEYEDVMSPARVALRVARRAIRRTAKRIRKLDEQIEYAERQVAYCRSDAFAIFLRQGISIERLSGLFAMINEARVLDAEGIEATRRTYINSGEKVISKLRTRLAIEVAAWKKFVDDYHKLCPPPALEEKATYRDAPPAYPF